MAVLKHPENICSSLKIKNKNLYKLRMEGGLLNLVKTSTKELEKYGTLCT